MTRKEMNEDIQNEILKEQNKEQIKKIVKIAVKIIIFIIIFTTIFYSYTTYISTIKVEVREYRITNNKIPTSFNGLKIIQLSDLHFGSTMFNDDLKKIVKLSNERKPDIVVFTGDLINKEYKLTTKEQEKIIKQLKSITSTLGKYAILGDEDDEKISTIFNQSDFQVLKDEYDLIYKDTNTPILLIGLTSKDKDIEKAYSYFKETTHNSDIYTITLTHEPDTVDDILSSYKTDLFMAGHSHNGNIRIPIVNYSFFRVKGAKKYYQDYYNIQDSKLYISSGLGTKNGIRLFCRPSINLYRLSNN